MSAVQPYDVPFPLEDLDGRIPRAGRAGRVGRLIYAAARTGTTPRSALLRHREVLALAAMIDRPDLAETTAIVVSHLAASGGLTEQSLDKMTTEIARFVRRLEWSGVAYLDDVTPGDVQEYLDESVERRDGKGFRAPEPGTVHVRRAAVRLLFRTARHAAITTAPDPTLDLQLPARTQTGVRPLTDEEELECRAAARSTLGSTRLPAAWALGQATATAGEIAAARSDHVELDRHRVWLVGTRRRDARWGDLTDWGVEHLARRMEVLGQPAAPLIYSAQRAAKSGATVGGGVLSEVLAMAGLGDEPLIKPQSLVAWAGRRVFAESGDIIQVAATLGLRSLDAAAHMIGEVWR